MAAFIVTGLARLVTGMSRRETAIPANVDNGCHGVTPPAPHAPPPMGKEEG